MDLVANAHVPDVGDIQLWSNSKADHLKPGQELLGYVKFSPIKAVFVRGVWVKLAGFNTLSLADSPDGASESFDLLMSDEDHFLGGVHDVLLGLGEEDEMDRNTNSDGALLQLGEGVHVWNFSFKIPFEAPLSFCDKNVEILYTATACVDIPGIPVVVSQITHNVIIGYSSGRQMQSAMSSSGAPVVSNSSSAFGIYQNEIVSVMPRPVLSRLLRSVMSTSDLQATCLKLQLPSNRPTFNFEFLSTSFAARCILDTDRVRCPLRVLARLLCCINTRRDPSMNFQSIEKLLEAVDAKAANPFKGSSLFGRKNENDGGVYSTLWSSSVTLISPKGQNIVDFEVPITIDPSLRASSLLEWPRPAPLPLESDCILNFTTCGPLFEYKIILAVSVHRGDQPAPLFAPCVAEIIVQPPSRPAVSTREVVPRLPLTIDTTAIGPPCSPPARRGRSFSTPRTSLGRTRAANMFTNPGSNSAASAVSGDYTPLGVQRQSLTLTVDAPINDENAPPVVRSVKRSSAKTSKEIRIRKNKSALPQATRSIPKVMGEAMSRGPAAVLQDRTNYQHRQVEITPSRFATAYEVGTGAVVMCDFSSLSLSSSSTPRLHSREALHLDYSPAMAFVCSANTARQMAGGDYFSPDGTLSPGSTTESISRQGLNRPLGGNAHTEPHTRRLLFSSIADIDETEDLNLNHSIVSAYTHSPLPLVMASRPHSRSLTTSRPLVLPM